jgi:predicted nucleic acid-binding protein
MYLLDTNVVSELRKVKSGKADKNVQDWSFQVDPQLLYISSSVIHEIELGILLAERSDKTKGRVLRKWMSEHVLPTFKERILSVDSDVAMISATYQVPNPKPYRDTLIAATAVVHGMTLVTRNISDFCLNNVKTLNPWDYRG